MKITRHIPPYNNESGQPVPGPDRDAAAGLTLTKWQKLASYTNGVATPATALSVAGAVLTGLGSRELIRHNYGSAVGAVAAGAICDALDGKVARALGVDSYVGGRYADAGLDGVKSAMVASASAASGTLPRAAAALTYSPKAAGWASSILFKIQGGDPQTSAEGKIAEAVRWTVPLMFICSLAAKEHSLNSVSKITNGLGWAESVVAFALGAKAFAGYAKSQSNKN